MDDARDVDVMTEDDDDVTSDDAEDDPAVVVTAILFVRGIEGGADPAEAAEEAAAATIGVEDDTPCVGPTPTPAAEAEDYLPGAATPLVYVLGARSAFTM